jgi:hypothetical protein
MTYGGTWCNGSQAVCGRAKRIQGYAAAAHRWRLCGCGVIHYSHGDDWMVLLVKLMLPRLAPLFAPAPVAWPPAPVAQIRLS